METIVTTEFSDHIDPIKEKIEQANAKQLPADSRVFYAKKVFFIPSLVFLAGTIALFIWAGIEQEGGMKIGAFVWGAIFCFMFLVKIISMFSTQYILLLENGLVSNFMGEITYFSYENISSVKLQKEKESNFLKGFMVLGHGLIGLLFPYSIFSNLELVITKMVTFDEKVKKKQVVIPIGEMKIEKRAFEVLQKVCEDKDLPFNHEK